MWQLIRYNNCILCTGYNKLLYFTLHYITGLNCTQLGIFDILKVVGRGSETQLSVCQIYLDVDNLNLQAAIDMIDVIWAYLIWADKALMWRFIRDIVAILVIIVSSWILVIIITPRVLVIVIVVWWGVLRLGVTHIWCHHWKQTTNTLY